ncbi:MAG: redoxin domain-containing protein [Bacteroidota bacterium]
MKLLRAISLCLLACGLSLTGNAQPLDSLSLLATDSSEIRLADYQDSLGIAVIFTSNHCVYSKKYEDRLLEMIPEYQARGIAFVLINANSPVLSSDDRLELMAERAAEKQYPCPYVKDRAAQLAKALGATKNPEAFVGKWTDEGLQIVYSGKIDDNPLMANRAEKFFLRDALESLLSESGVPVTQVPPVGCAIKVE